jgi:hypothetical protein
MAAGENQSQAVVFDFLLGTGGIRRGGIVQTLGHGTQRSIESSSTANHVDCFEASCRNQPGGRIARDAVLLPLR